MLHGLEILQRFGGSEIVDSGSLPMGMSELFNSGRMSWQELIFHETSLIQVDSSFPSLLGT